MNFDRLSWTVRYYWNTLLNATIIDRRKLYAAWEQVQLAKLLDYLNVDCVFDIGANEGQYAEMLRRKVGYRGLIISFEPIPQAAEIVRAKAKADPNWIVIEAAISEFDGVTQFNVMNQSQFSSLSTPRHDDVNLFIGQNEICQSIEVTVELLATALNRLRQSYHFKRPFLKMDTQGFDYKIVNCSKSVIREFVGLQSELAIKKLYEDSIDFRDSLALYESCGFSLTAFVPNNPGHFPRLLETDCLMIRADLIETAGQ